IDVEIRARLKRGSILNVIAGSRDVGGERDGAGGIRQMIKPIRSQGIQLYNSSPNGLIIEEKSPLIEKVTKNDRVRHTDTLCSESSRGIPPHNCIIYTTAGCTISKHFRAVNICCRRTTNKGNHGGIECAGHVTS